MFWLSRIEEEQLLLDVAEAELLVPGLALRSLCLGLLPVGLAARELGLRGEWRFPNNCICKINAKLDTRQGFVIFFRRNICKRHWGQINECKCHDIFLNNISRRHENLGLHFTITAAGNFLDKIMTYMGPEQHDSFKELKRSAKQKVYHSVSQNTLCLKIHLTSAMLKIHCL